MDSIFLIQDKQLVALPATDYASEALLQQALADYPEVLAGGTTGGVDRMLLLVSREMGIATVEGGSATFSLDHLFIDTEGVPVLVEVKRSSDTRIRREVVGQMLDYAANAVRYWPVATMRQQMEKAASGDASAGGGNGSSAEKVLQEHGVDPETFWTKVESNLREGRIRMVFVADRLPPELIRIIEFLNEQMKPAEVLGVEVVQYRAGESQVLVPRRIGVTAKAVTNKEGGTGTRWDEESFLTTAVGRCSPGELDIINTLFQHVKTKGVRRNWGRGVGPGVSGVYRVADTDRAVWTLSAGQGSTGSKANLYFWIGEIRDLADPAAFATFIDSVTAIPAFKADFDKARAAGFTNKYPGGLLKALTVEQVDELLTAIDALAGAKVGNGVSTRKPQEGLLATKLSAI